jgi:hypothetical protein
LPRFGTEESRFSTMISARKPRHSRHKEVGPTQLLDHLLFFFFFSFFFSKELVLSHTRDWFGLLGVVGGVLLWFSERQKTATTAKKGESERTWETTAREKKQKEKKSFGCFSFFFFLLANWESKRQKAETRNTIREKEKKGRGL